MKPALKENRSMTLAQGILSGKVSVASAEMSLTISETLNKPVLRALFKDNKEICFNVVNTLVKRFVDSFGFSTKLNGVQVDTISVDMIENFGYESLEDIILFLKMARGGKFGTTSRGLDSNLIFGEWFPRYMEVKALEREKQYERKKDSEKSRQNDLRDVAVTYSKYIGKTQEQKKKQKVKDYIEKITSGITRQELENMIIDWSVDENKKPYLDLLKRKRRDIK